MATSINLKESYNKTVSIVGKGNLSTKYSFNASPKDYPQPITRGSESPLELLSIYNVHKGITTSCLKALESKGNLSASELLRNVNHTVSMEDLQQQVFLSFCENMKEWNISQDGKVDFLTDDCMKSVFGAVSKYLYQFQTKHYKHQYIEFDGLTIDVDKSTSFAEYIAINGFKYSDLLFIMFKNRLSENDCNWLEHRINGLSNLAISKAMDVSYEKIRATEKRVRRIWNSWNE